MARLSYLKGNSYFHNMDPTWKFIWNFIMIVIAILNFEIWYSATLFIYLLILTLFLAKISIKQYIKSISLFLGIAIFICIWASIYYPEAQDVIFIKGPIRVTLTGVTHGISLVFRVLVIATLSIIFVMTTDPAKLVESFIHVAKIPYRIGYTFYATLRFIPLYENETEIMMNAHQVRGVGKTGKGFISKLMLYKSIIIPLLVSGIRRAQVASIAMDSRGFGAYKSRTFLHKVSVKKSTKWFVIFHILLLLVTIYYSIMLGYGTHFLG